MRNNSLGKQRRYVLLKFSREYHAEAAFLKDQLETFVEQLCALIPSLISLCGEYSERLDDGNLLSDCCVFVHKTGEEDRRQTVTVRRYRFERGKYEIW